MPTAFVHTCLRVREPAASLLEPTVDDGRTEPYELIEGRFDTPQDGER